MNLRFDHPPETLKFWRELVSPLVASQPTPFYLFSARPIESALAELDQHFKHLPIRHWLSFKTQPLRPLLQWWRAQGRPIEVVSEFEFLAAMKEGFTPDQILINGPAKHHWLPRHPVPGLRVNLDSVNETQALAPLAKKLAWTVGLRLNTPEEFDPEHSDHPTQFGMVAEELVCALAILHREGVTPQIAHFHLRTNINSPDAYERALNQAAQMCREAGFAPRFVDCGGGYPAPLVLSKGGKKIDAGFSLKSVAGVYQRSLKLFPELQELWLENGRWLSARSGVLVVKVLDVKERRGMRNLICDGGRTMNALVSIWENHELISVPERTGPECLTTVNGPTCMAFDQLARRELPRSIEVGDHLIWLEAGAYHLPWETRFSHGLTRVLWHDGQRIELVREQEDFADWWGQWQPQPCSAEQL